MDTYFYFENEDALDEIFNMRDFYEESDNEDDQSFNQFLNSNYDY